MKQSPIQHFGFQAANYKWLLIGLAINILGFLLMIGGSSEDPNEFKADELFSTTRITIAPMLIVLGYGVIFYSIMKRNKPEQKNEVSTTETGNKTTPTKK
jgi:cytochrome bd-type quinol oxidase subunit 2